MTKPDPKKNADDLVKFVLDLKASDDRGALAMLRGSLTASPDRQMRSWRILAHFHGIPSQDGHLAEVVRTVAGLLALRNLQHSPNGKSFGEAWRIMLSDDEQKTIYNPESPGPVSRRFQHLLSATRPEVCGRVNQLGRRLENEQAKINFNALYLDLIHWGDIVKAKWAADFWQASEQDSNLEVKK